MSFAEGVADGVLGRGPVCFAEGVADGVVLAARGVLTPMGRECGVSYREEALYGERPWHKRRRSSHSQPTSRWMSALSLGRAL